jgi:hypothetical protein
MDNKKVHFFCTCGFKHAVWLDFPEKCPCGQKHDGAISSDDVFEMTFPITCNIDGCDKEHKLVIFNK